MKTYEFRISSTKFIKGFYTSKHISLRIQIHVRVQFIVLAKKLQFIHFRNLFNTFSYTVSYLYVVFTV